MNQPLILCTATNHAYAMGATVAICSALRRSPGCSGEPVVYILDGGLREGDWRKISESVKRVNSSAKLIRLKPDMAQFTGLPEDWGSSVMTYARLALPELVEAPRVIYLDADMIIREDLSPLMTLNLEEKVIAAARDVITATISGDHLPVQPLGLDPDADYFQAGFLVIDMERWREEKVSERVMAYLRDYPDHARYWDQSALNVVLYKCWSQLGDEWNTPAFWADTGKGGTTLEAPVIHFVGPDKAWLRQHSKKPSAGRFFYELDQTAWRGWRPSRLRDALKWIKYQSHRILRARRVA